MHGSRCTRAHLLGRDRAALLLLRGGRSRVRALRLFGALREQLHACMVKGARGGRPVGGRQVRRGRRQRSSGGGGVVGGSSWRAHLRPLMGSGCARHEHSEPSLLGSSSSSSSSE